jgi:NAD dependent epimerase/dehydratase family enzyme
MMNKKSKGIYNLVAPTNSTNYEFSKLLARKMNRPLFLRIPEWLLQLVFLNGATVITEGQKAIPERLLGEGFNFQYNTLDECLENIVNQYGIQ